MTEPWRTLRAVSLRPLRLNEMSVFICEICGKPDSAITKQKEAKKVNKSVHLKKVFTEF
jgi:hypothetical protein